jgi:hypothetical protein
VVDGQKGEIEKGEIDLFEPFVPFPPIYQGK